MPTYARKHQLAASLIYHVYNRSHSRVPIFKRQQDYLYFIKLLESYVSRFGLKIYHWAIMPNHYHLLLELADPELISKIMAGLSKAYSCYHHKVYSIAGFLWQGRFKLQPVQKEKYLIACGRYIERNPVKAGIVTEAHEYPYSSAKFYTLGEIDGITVEDPAFSKLSADANTRRKMYLEFLRDFNERDEVKFDDLEKPLGDKIFIRQLLKANGRFMPKRRGRPRKRIVA